MRWVIFSLLILTGSAICDDNPDQSNEIYPSSSLRPINLDSNLRRALLRALTELENEEIENSETQSTQIPLKLPNIDTSDKIITKASASQVNFYATSEAPETPTTQKTKQEERKEKHKSLVIVQKSAGQHKSIVSLEKDDLNPIDDAEQFLASATSSFASNEIERQKTLRETKTAGSKLNSLDENKSKSKLRKQKVQVTTTLRPTSSTEESEAKVEDLQFFSAPLVAAFTVHQDERGLPKSVVPIYKQNGQSSITSKQVDEKLQRQRDEILRKDLEKQRKIEEEKRQQQEIQDKQKALEEEIVRLRKLKEEQDELIRKQRILYEQQLIQQRQKLIEETRSFRQSQQDQTPFIPITTSNPIRNFNQFDNGFNKNTLVSVQSSVPFVSPQAGLLPSNGQILPTKLAVDFRTPFQTPNYHPFPKTTQTSFNPLISPSFSQPFVNFNQAPLVDSSNNFRLVQSLQPPHATPINSFFRPEGQFLSNRGVSNTGSSTGTRVFRQESGTGNFVNDNRNFFSSFSQQPHRFRSNVQVQPSVSFSSSSVQQPLVNQRLNNLLYYSGIGQGKQQEDLNIVSKVLSLNHLGGDPRFAASSIYEQRVPYVRLVSR